MSTALELMIDVHQHGDVVLILSNLAGVSKMFGLRVSSHALRFSSPVFNDMLTRYDASKSQTGDGVHIHLPNEDGDTMFMLCTALHLRNTALPHRLSPEQLRQFAMAAVRYQCVVAAGRAATVWFDYIYSDWADPPLFSMIEAAYLLDDAVFFARFTSRWILSSVHTSDPVCTSRELQFRGGNHETITATLERVMSQLSARRTSMSGILQADIETLVESCANCLADEAKHDIDIPPDDDLGEDFVNDEPRIPCLVDKDGAILYLCALRNNAIWPMTRWPKTLGEVVDRVADFRVPDYDNSDKCCFCQDVVMCFARSLEHVRLLHHQRLWGLCLDCVKPTTPDGQERAGGCRVEHRTKKPSMSDGASSLSLRTTNLAGAGPAQLVPTMAGTQALVTPVTPTVSGGGLNGQ